MPLTASDLPALSRTRHMVDGGELRRVRERAALTQGEIAEVCGVSVSCVSRWESGEILPRSTNARALSDIIAVLERAS
jgi:DNA-binding transcriptional regulator YiaG